ncbi:MAG TPA: YggS family pyridoxal phosphate-dependent enzyme [Bacteroidales bacterium]|nr:YggS family pyridoxal phosphate-dependent enzyme [Bacteroidales bacterium]HBH85964.1 YggS family pyridoxal phosphate-dependent enzyme [Bacteroidales bacterium]HBQ83027.1 YggS family pyridoxal phosphate-dependent enzyme [Bacteroidales bacterium]HCU19882.1 YggS family pyridoxal phosphate-dependent enzyme [Bacteroidales bacterium]
MTDIASNISLIRGQLPPAVRLVAVSKTKPVNDILEAYSAGQRCFGENRVQELLGKKDHVPWDIEWHLIGHLQSNKVKFIVPFISMIQSVDSFRLLRLINREASGINRVVNCLLQIHIASEDSKFGFSIEEMTDTDGISEFGQMNFVRICGVMGMATYTTDYDQVKREFSYLKECFNILKNNCFNASHHFREISMGMSGDYQIAIEAGSTMVRIGSLVFGERVKKQQ